MNNDKVTLPSGEEISREFYEKLISVTSKRAKQVIEKLMKDGSCTTDELIDMGYNHAPRAKRDVVEAGIPIEKRMIKNPDTGRRMAEYRLGDWEKYKEQNSLSKTNGRNNLTDKLKNELIKEYGCKCMLYGEDFPEMQLQIDHRIPFEIGGDPENMMDISKFMLLSPSANRAKSWACEHCSNWVEKNIEMCKKCYYAFPENYQHIAGEEEKRLDIIFRTQDMEIYDMILEVAKGNNISKQEAFKRIAKYAQKMKENF